MLDFNWTEITSRYDPSSHYPYANPLPATAKPELSSSNTSRGSPSSAGSTTRTRGDSFFARSSTDPLAPISTAGGSNVLGLGVRSGLLSSATALTSTKSNFPSATIPASTTFLFAASNPELDPATPAPSALCCPADGKVLVYPQLTAEDVLPVKSGQLAAHELLAETIDPTPYHGGAALVVRLAPYDYHRFHFPSRQPSRSDAVDQRHLSLGQPHRPRPRARRIPPQPALRLRASRRPPSAGLPTSRLVPSTSPASSRTYSPGPCERGQEKGFFQFGGSTVVLLFEPGAIAFDSDLVTDSAAGLEVHVRTGAGVGGRA